VVSPSLSGIDPRGAKRQPAPAGLADAQTAIAWAEHLVLLFPLWLGDMPALVKAFLEQVARPGFAFDRDDTKPFGRGDG